MTLASSNVRKLANATTLLFLTKVPFKSLHKTFLHPVVHALSPPLLRNAMNFPEVSPHFIKMIESMLHLQSFLVSHVVLPKSIAQARTSLTDEEYEATQMNESVENTNSTPKQLFTNFDQFASTYKDVYRIEELGPAHSCPMIKTRMKMH